MKATKTITNLTETINGRKYNVYMSKGSSRRTYYVKIGDKFIITSKKDCDYEKA